MKINFTTDGCITFQEAQANQDYAVGHGVKWIEPGAGGGRPLAVVGGGPSILEHLEELRNWEGEIWAINGAFQWCRENGIEATFATADPFVVEAARGAGKAIVCSACAPQLFDLLKSSDVRMYRISFHPEDIAPGATTATMAPLVAAKMGYGAVTFFGCESSYGEYTHAYSGLGTSEFMEVATKDGEKYWTEPGFLMQAESLAHFIKTWPEIYSERSGGLLRSLVSNNDWEITQVSNPLMKKITITPVPVEAEPCQ